MMTESVNELVSLSVIMSVSLLVSESISINNPSVQPVGQSVSPAEIEIERERQTDRLTGTDRQTDNKHPDRDVYIDTDRNREIQK